MVKQERKINHGMTNLSTSRSLSELNTTNQINNNNNSNNNDESNKTKFYRSWSHKLLAPDMYQPPISHANYRYISKTATWNPAPLYERDFSTTFQSSFSDPRDKPPIYEHKELTFEELEQLQVLTKKQKESMKVLTDEAKLLYGTTSSMLKSFHKKDGDMITLDEFNQYMIRNKIENTVTPLDQQLIFDLVESNNNGSISINDLLKKAEEVEFFNAQHVESMLEMRDFLKRHIEDHRNNNNKNSTSTLNELKFEHLGLEELKKTKGLKNEAELLKKALGQKTFDLNVHPHELQDTIDGLYNNQPQNFNDRKILNYIRNSNLNLSLVPFYEMRQNELENMKIRSALIDKQLEDPSKMDKLNELAKVRWIPSLATITRSEALALTRNNHDRRNSSVVVVDGDGRSSSGDRAASTGIINDKKPRNLITEMSAGDQLTTSSKFKSIIPSIHNNHKDDDDDNNDYKSVEEKILQSSSLSSSRNREKLGLSATIASASSTTLPNKVITKVEKIKKDLFEIQKNDDNDFYLEIVEEGNSMHRSKDYSRVMKVEKIDDTAYLTTGKRILSKKPTDWGRVGIGGTREKGDIGYGHNDEDNFLSTTATFYPPLIYESSRPVRRDIMSESTKAFLQKEYKRKERFERRKANMDVTQIRLEHDELEKEIQQQRKNQSKLQNHIKYATSILLSDLQSYKSQPLQRVSLRQNVTLADRMWNGNAEKQNVVIVPDTRDFKSTYNQDFDSSILKSTLHT